MLIPFSSVCSTTPTQAFTVIATEEVPEHPFASVKLYVALCVPTPAVAGLSEEPETPGPDHVPPAGVPVKASGASERQTVVKAAVPFTVGGVLIVTIAVSVPVQPLALVTTTTYVPVVEMMSVCDAVESLHA